MGQGGRAPLPSSRDKQAATGRSLPDPQDSRRSLCPPPPALRPNHPSPASQGASSRILPRNSGQKRARAAPSLPAAPEDLLEQGERAWPAAVGDGPEGGAHRPGTRAQACARHCMRAFPAQQRRRHPKQTGAFLIAQLRPRHCSGAERTPDGRSSPSTAPQATTEGGSTLQATGGKRRAPPKYTPPREPVPEPPTPSMLFSPPPLCLGNHGCLNSGPTAEGVLWTAARGRSSLED